MSNLWLISKKVDLFGFFIPVWLIWIVFFLCPVSFLEQDLPIWMWVVFVMAIDVGHVWTTLFRTYLDKDEWSRHRSVFISTPIFVFICCFLLASYEEILFWRVLAYLAVFHFVKQQFGFLALYSAKSIKKRNKKIFSDRMIIYWATLFPIVYWHLNSNANFSWFVESDFLQIHQWIPEGVLSYLLLGLHIIYWVPILIWLIEETVFSGIQINGKILWTLTTAINWYFGIVYFNSDIVFTVSNVVAHGVPYIILVHYYNVKKDEISNKKSSFWKKISVVLVSILLLAFIEEYLWNAFVYGDDESFYSKYLSLPSWQANSKLIRAFFFALLALPQVTHYWLDGIIWKANESNPYMREIFKNKSKL